MNAGSLHAHAGTYGVDAVVVALYGNLCTLTRYACHGTDKDKSVVDFGHFELEEAAQEILACARHRNLGIIVLVIYVIDHCTHGFALAVEVARNLLVLGEQKLVLVVVEKQNLALPELIDLTRRKFALHLLKFGVDCVFLQVENLACKRLAQVENGTASEAGEVNLLGVVFAYLAVGVGIIGVVFSVGDADLLHRVNYLAVGDDFEVLVNFAVAFVGVHNHIEVFIAAKHLGDDTAKRFLQDANHCGLVDVFQLLKFRKTIHHINGFLFLCHSRVVKTLLSI